MVHFWRWNNKPQSNQISRDEKPSLIRFSHCKYGLQLSKLFSLYLGYLESM